MSPFDKPPSSGAGASTTTDTTEGARAHARAQAGAVAEFMRSIPATSYAPLDAGVDASTLLWAERVGGGSYTSRVVAAGTTIRITDIDGDACAHLLLYRDSEPWERLCVADTVKVLWQAYTARGQVLLSDQGRVLASVVVDTSGLHDSLCGTSSRRRNEDRYGDGSAQGQSPSGRELFVLAGAKHGLGPRDLPPSLSLFKGVRVDPGLRGSSLGRGLGSGAHVELRAEMPLLVLVVNTAHPIDPRPVWSCGGLEILAWPGEPTRPGEWPWHENPETERAYMNTVDDLGARRAGQLG